ncbi:MAG: cytochrome b/b6 domain-containing protein [Opitutae bacterium]|nr:cytochrome b/b6 domain-containing protein [Opitutae bacterium]
MQKLAPSFSPFRPGRLSCVWRGLGLIGGLLVAIWGRAAETPAATAAPAAATPAPNSDANCLECHSDEKLSMKKGEKKLSLFTEPKTLAKSAHSSLACIDCHEGFNAESSPHKKPMTPVDCRGCHEKVEKKHAFHPQLAQAKAPDSAATSCSGCHGTHAVAKLKGPDSPYARSKQADTCGRCHEAAREAFRASAHGKKLAEGMAESPDCLACHRQPITNVANKKPTVALKVAQDQLCESCHVAKAEIAGQSVLGSHFVSSYENSVHGAALQRGIAESANCVDCHGSHEMNQAMVAGSRVNKLHMVETCAKCHRAQTAEFNFSVHAVSLRKGNLDSPVCTDCHGSHDITTRANQGSPVHARNVAQETCGSCHASSRITKKYGMARDAFQTYADSYHGLAGRGGSVEVVNCVSCHSSHAIKTAHDRTSSTYKGNLVATCGKCHPGANAGFTVGRVHASVDQRKDSPVLYWVANFYVLLIVLCIGGMTVHNLTDFIRKLLHKLAQQKGEIPEEPVPHVLHVRMTVHERLQHAVLGLSFMLLVVTGFMLRYPDAWWVVAIRNLSTGTFEMRSLIHRVAGVVLMASGFWHAGYLALTPAGRKLFFDLLPRWCDVIDPWRVLRYNLGFSQEKPKFGRFSYIEKAEYWALIWGTAIMGLTGVILWFENTSIGLVTKLGFDVSRVVHFYEAILATLAILVWHIYFVIFNPDVYPMNLAWLTGRMSEKEMLDEHPLHLEELKKQQQQSNSGEKPQDKSGPPAA